MSQNTNNLISGSNIAPLGIDPNAVFSANTIHQPQYTFTTGSNGSWGSYHIPPSFGTISIQEDTKPALHVTGDANFESDVKIKGKSIVELFQKIEERLNILHPNIELEERWEELKLLGKRYRELEKQIIEKEKIWNILQK